MHIQSTKNHHNHLALKEDNLSEERIKTILAASIIRYLKGRTSLSFITDLSTELSERHDISLHGDLLEVVSVLNHLNYQVKFTNLSEHLITERLHRLLDKLHPEDLRHKN